MYRYVQCVCVSVYRITFNVRVYDKKDLFSKIKINEPRARL